MISTKLRKIANKIAYNISNSDIDSTEFKVDLKIVKNYDSSPPYLRLLKKEIKNGVRMN